MVRPASPRSRPPRQPSAQGRAGGQPGRLGGEAGETRKVGVLGERVQRYRPGRAPRRDLRASACRARSAVSRSPPGAVRGLWPGRPVGAGAGDGKQVAGKIAAVDGGDIGRVEHAQVARVVPVVEMAAKARHPAHGLERLLQPFGGAGAPEPAHVLRHGDGQKVEPDIGGRGSVRHGGAGRFLEIVGREEVVLGRDEGFEEAPGAPRDLAQAGRSAVRSGRAGRVARAGG